jgi:hypothetical protein
MSVRCFWLEPTGEIRYHLTFEEKGDCPASWDGKTHRAEAPCSKEQFDDRSLRGDVAPPAACARCGYAFSAAAEWCGGGSERVYRRVDTGEECSPSSAPPGAMWDAYWLKSMYAPTEDGRIIMVRCPDGSDWCIDSRASNCTMPNDKVHHCWIRHGEPPNLTVDKAGVTCQAGAGSIMVTGYHGFLRGGEFTPNL